MNAFAKYMEARAKWAKAVRAIPEWKEMQKCFEQLDADTKASRKTGFKIILYHDEPRDKMDHFVKQYHEDEHGWDVFWRTDLTRVIARFSSESEADGFIRGTSWMIDTFKEMADAGITIHKNVDYEALFRHTKGWHGQQEIEHITAEREFHQCIPKAMEACRRIKS